MKKAYTRPELFFESFSLMEAIAVPCVLPVQGNKDRNSCYWDDPDLEIRWLLNRAVCQEVDGSGDGPISANTEGSL